MPPLLAGLGNEAIHINPVIRKRQRELPMKAATDQCDTAYSTLTPRQNAT